MEKILNTHAGFLNITSYGMLGMSAFPKIQYKNKLTLIDQKNEKTYTHGDRDNFSLNFKEFLKLQKAIVKNRYYVTGISMMCIEL